VDGSHLIKTQAAAELFRFGTSAAHMLRARATSCRANMPMRPGDESHFRTDCATFHPTSLMTSVVPRQLRSQPPRSTFGLHVVSKAVPYGQSRCCLLTWNQPMRSAIAGVNKGPLCRLHEMHPGIMNTPSLVI
jgi:hypothetical protein